MAIYSDNFNRTDSTTVSGWTEITDDWSIKSNQLAPGLSTTGVILYNSPLATSDHYAQITISAATTTSMGVFARADVNATNYYLLRNNGSSWDLFSNTAGTFISIGSYSAAAVNGDVARIQCIGTTIKAIINGTERISVTDSAVTTGLYAGVRSTQSSTTRYDNFTTADTGVTGSADPGAFFAFM